MKARLRLVRRHCAPPPPPPPSLYVSLAHIFRASPPYPSSPSADQLVSKDDPNQIYSDMKKIGEGAAGEVFLAFDKSGNKVAVKKMQLNGESLKLLITEISIMKSSSHPNIVNYYASYIVEDQLWVVMEFMGGGCLTEVLEQFDSVQMTEPQMAFASNETLKALLYIHQLHRIHRDIKSDNILLGDDGSVKIGTFVGASTSFIYLLIHYSFVLSFLLLTHWCFMRIADFGYAAQLTKKQQKRNTVVGVRLLLSSLSISAHLSHSHTRARALSLALSCRPPTGWRLS